MKRQISRARSVRSRGSQPRNSRPSDAYALEQPLYQAGLEGDAETTCVRSRITAIRSGDGASRQRR